eukprot:1423122-Amphidinium_carterae.1
MSNGHVLDATETTQSSQSGQCCNRQSPFNISHLGSFTAPLCLNSVPTQALQLSFEIAVMLMFLGGARCIAVVAGLASAATDHLDHYLDLIGGFVAQK